MPSRYWVHVLVKVMIRREKQQQQEFIERERELDCVTEAIHVETQSMAWKPSF